MHRLGMQQAAVEREHQMASSLAQAILPAAAPVLDGVDVFAETIPARLAGGDFYTFDVLDGVLWFAVGDVAGKGLPAAIVMTRAVSAARVAFHTHAEDDPAGALAAVGEELFDYLHAVGLFVTMALGAYRPGSGILYVCNAGHSPVLTVVHRRTSAVPPTTPPVGVLPTAKGRTQAIPFEFGSALVLGSDGLIEQEDPAGSLYGYERFERKLIEFSGLSLRNMGARLMQDVDRYAHGTAPSDDRTLVVLRGIA
jgi:serine phosphatase RsbU (regulator of sigma subunit)